MGFSESFFVAFFFFLLENTRDVNKNLPVTVEIQI